MLAAPRQHRLQRNFCPFIHLTESIHICLNQVLADLGTFLHKAIPDTRMTIGRYADAKFEYLSYCLKVCITWNVWLLIPNLMNSFFWLGDELGQRNGRRRAELPHATRAFLQDRNGKLRIPVIDTSPIPYRVQMLIYWLAHMTQIGSSMPPRRQGAIRRSTVRRSGIILKPRCFI